MHSFEFQSRIDRFFAELEKAEPFMAALTTLSNAAGHMNSQMAGLADGGSGQTQSGQNIHAFLAGMNKAVSKGNHRQFFKALEHFQSSIASLAYPADPGAKLVSSLSAEVEEFSTFYDTFLSNQSGKNALPLLLSAQRLHTELRLLQDLLELVRESIGSQGVPSSSEASLALWLPESIGLTDFAHRLLALQSMYSEVCMLLSISEDAHPLRISKIESGSLWAWVFGESRAIKMVTSFIEQTASWIFRNYTVEGRISEIPRRVEAVDSLLGLTQRLKEAGMNPSEMQHHIEKSAVALSKELATLLDGQGSVTVNDKKISVGTELNKLHLEQTSSLRLDGPTEASAVEEKPLLPPSN